MTTKPDDTRLERALRAEENFDQIELRELGGRHHRSLAGEAHLARAQGTTGLVSKRRIWREGCW